MNDVLTRTNSGVCENNAHPDIMMQCIRNRDAHCLCDPSPLYRNVDLGAWRPPGTIQLCIWGDGGAGRMSVIFADPGPHVMPFSTQIVAVSVPT